MVGDRKMTTFGGVLVNLYANSKYSRVGGAGAGWGAGGGSTCTVQGGVGCVQETGADLYYNYGLNCV